MNRDELFEKQKHDTYKDMVIAGGLMILGGIATIVFLPDAKHWENVSNRLPSIIAVGEAGLATARFIYVSMIRPLLWAAE